MPCKTGSSCSANVTGVTLETLPLMPGYYRVSNDSDDLRRCPDFGDSSGCVGGVSLGEGPCKEWLTGPYCRLCNVTDRSRYFNPDRSACLVCEGDAGAPLAIGFGLFIAVLAIVLLWARFKPHRNVRWLARLMPWVSRLSAQLSLRPKGKQLLSFCEWPPFEPGSHPCCKSADPLFASLSDQVATRVADVYEVCCSSMSTSSFTLTL